MPDNIYQHYRTNEQPFIDEVFGWIQQVSDFYTPYLTPFLTPREILIVKQLTAPHEDIHVDFNGGLNNAERKRALIYPEYYVPQIEDYELSLIDINYPTKFGELSHGRVLGTILSTGIERNRVGDIFTDGEHFQFMIDQPMTPYILQQIDQVHRIGVKLREVSFDEMITPIDRWEARTVISSSLRLDTLVSNVYNFSRQRAKNAISAGKIQINFAVAERPDIPLEIEDLISVRGHGRFSIQSVDGTTRKDNYRLTVNVLSN